jgi:hypothetical protein
VLDNAGCNIEDVSGRAAFKFNNEAWYLECVSLKCIALKRAALECCVFNSCMSIYLHAKMFCPTSDMRNKRTMRVRPMLSLRATGGYRQSIGKMFSANKEIEGRILSLDD